MDLAIQKTTPDTIIEKKCSEEAKTKWGEKVIDLTNLSNLKVHEA